MSNSSLRIGAVALALAVLAAFATTPGSWDRFRFTVGNYDMDGEKRAIEDTLQLFSATMSGFYQTGGVSAGLNIFPAEKPVKRRIFHDIAVYASQHLVLVTDRDRSTVREILFSDKSHATAIVEEIWVMQFQQDDTRKPVSNKKLNTANVRYYLEKSGGKWIVDEFEVYGQGDIIPRPQPERFLQ